MYSIMFNAGVQALLQRREEVLNPPEISINLLEKKENQTILFAIQVANRIVSKEQRLTVLIPRDAESTASPLIEGVEMNEFHYINVDEFQKLFDKSNYNCEESGPCGDGYRLFLVSVT